MKKIIRNKESLGESINLTYTIKYKDLLHMISKGEVDHSYVTDKIFKYANKIKIAKDEFDRDKLTRRCVIQFDMYGEIIECMSMIHIQSQFEKYYVTLHQRSMSVDMRSTDLTILKSIASYILKDQVDDAEFCIFINNYHKIF